MAARQAGGPVGPSQQRELLLQAVTAGGGEALAAFEAWRGSVDLDGTLEGETLALLPLLYGRLQRLGLDDPLMGRLKGLCRRTWYENQVLLGSAREAVACLAEAGIESLLVGDLPLALTHYESRTARRIGQIDVVVPRSETRLAARRLGAAGWVSSSPLSEEEVAYHHMKRLARPGSGVLDLHWHCLDAACGAAVDGYFWASTREFALDGASARQLRPTSQLLHLLLASHSSGAAPSGLWVADALAIIGSAGEEVDWGQMTAFAIRQGLAFRLRNRLEHLAAGYGAPVPDSALSALRGVKASLPEWVDSIALRGGKRRQRGGLAVWRCEVVADYLRSDRRAGAWHWSADFSHFVRYRWGLKGRSEILPAVARHVWRAARLGWS